MRKVYNFQLPKSFCFKASLRFQSYQFKVSDVGSYQCILSIGGLLGQCLLFSVLGGPCKSTDAACNRLKSYVGSDWEPKKIFYIWSYQPINNVKWRWGPNDWNNVCWKYDHRTPNMKVFVNNQTFEFPVASLHFYPQADLNIFFMNSNSKTRNESFHGAITDVQMWSRGLTESEVRSWADCGSEDAGDLIDWSRTELNITGLAQLTAERDSVCGRKENRTIIAAFNRRLNFYDSAKFCSYFGQIASAWEEWEREQMFLSLNAVEGPTCNTDIISAGIMWTEAAQAWSEVTTGRKISVENWYQGRPSNNTEADNCLFVINYDRTFYDTACTFSELCPVCKITKVGKISNNEINILLTLLRIYN